MDKEHTAIARLQEAARTSEKFHKGKVERCCVCDYYDYYGDFINNCFFGQPMTMSANPEIRNIKVKGKLSNGYRYWSPLIERREVPTVEEYPRPKTIEELKQFCADKGMPLE